MNVQVLVPCTLRDVSELQVYPWNRHPSSLLMASSHCCPAVGVLSSLYSAAFPVSGLMAVAPMPGSNLGLCLGATLLPSTIGTPRLGAGVCGLGFSFVSTGCCDTVWKKLIIWDGLGKGCSKGFGWRVLEDKLLHLLQPL